MTYVLDKDKEMRKFYQKAILSLVRRQWHYFMKHKLYRPQFLGVITNNLLVIAYDS